MGVVGARGVMDAAMTLLEGRPAGGKRRADGREARRGPKIEVVPGT
jgi:hypothetical protein